MNNIKNADKIEYFTNTEFVFDKQHSKLQFILKIKFKKQNIKAETIY